jgi:nucleotide-binding universal stress UspA family protein
MIERVLVPMDESEMAQRALEYAIEAHPDATITVLNVVGEPSPMMGQATGLALADDVEETAEEYASEVLDRARAVAADQGVEIETAVAAGHPARAILNTAPDYDVIVLGTHGGSLSDRLLIGNVAEKVFRQSPVTVTVVR